MEEHNTHDDTKEAAPRKMKKSAKKEERIPDSPKVNKLKKKIKKQQKDELTTSSKKQTAASSSSSSSRTDKKSKKHKSTSDDNDGDDDKSSSNKESAKTKASNESNSTITSRKDESRRKEKKEKSSSSKDSGDAILNDSERSKKKKRSKDKSKKKGKAQDGDEQSNDDERSQSKTVKTKTKRLQNGDDDDDGITQQRHKRKSTKREKEPKKHKDKSSIRSTSTASLSSVTPPKRRNVERSVSFTQRFAFEQSAHSMEMSEHLKEKYRKSTHKKSSSKVSESSSSSAKKSKSSRDHDQAPLGEPYSKHSTSNSSSSSSSRKKKKKKSSKRDKKSEKKQSSKRHKEGKKKRKQDMSLDDHTDVTEIDKAAETIAQQVADSHDKGRNNHNSGLLHSAHEIPTEDKKQLDGEYNNAATLSNARDDDPEERTKDEYSDMKKGLQSQEPATEIEPVAIQNTTSDAISAQGRKESKHFDKKIAAQSDSSSDDSLSTEMHSEMVKDARNESPTEENAQSELALNDQTISSTPSPPLPKPDMERQVSTEPLDNSDKDEASVAASSNQNIASQSSVSVGVCLKTDSTAVGSKDPVEVSSSDSARGDGDIRTATGGVDAEKIIQLDAAVASNTTEGMTDRNHTEPKDVDHESNDEVATDSPAIQSTMDNDEVDKPSIFVEPHNFAAFQEILNDCTLEVCHASQPAVAKKGNFRQYTHPNFCEISNTDEDDKDGNCLSITVEGINGRCDIRHHLLWGVKAARYSYRRSGVILCSTSLSFEPFSKRIQEFTLFQIIHTSYELPSSVAAGTPQLFTKKPLLRITASREVDANTSEGAGTAYKHESFVLMASLRKRRRQKEKHYRLGTVVPQQFFQLDIYIVFDPDSQRYEVGIDLEEENCVMKNIDDWLRVSPTNYFQLGCHINYLSDQGDDDGEGEGPLSGPPSMKVLCRKLDVNIPSGDPPDDLAADEEEEDEEEDPSTSVVEESESHLVENMDSNSQNNAGSSESEGVEYVSDSESSSSDASSEEWDEVSVSDDDGSSRSSGSSSHDSVSSYASESYSSTDGEEWDEIPVIEEEDEEMADEDADEESDDWAEIPVSDDGENESQAGNEPRLEGESSVSDEAYSDTEYSLSEVTVHSSGSAFYVSVDETEEKGLMELANRKQVQFVITREKMIPTESNRGYDKIADWTDLSVSVYEAVKKASAGSRIFVLGKLVKQKLKSGEMVGFMSYGTGDNLRKVPFSACKKTPLRYAIDEVLPVTEHILPVKITYEQAVNMDDDEEELSD